MNINEAKILVVDDLEDNRNILARRLKRQGFIAIEEAADGISALNLIRDRTVDLVLLDVMMPGMNGVEVLQTMKTEGLLDATPVIMISAASEVETVVSCLESGAEDYLPKPFNPTILRARVHSVLEKKCLRAELQRQLARFEAEIAIARTQQLAMVPTDFDLPGLNIDLHATMQPATEVGGDLYDFFRISEDEVFVAIGDVSGKGMPAALFMARARSLLRAGTLQHCAIAGQRPTPAELAVILNDELCKNNENCLFMTLLAGFLNLKSGLFSYVNAGHLPAILIGPQGAAEVACEVDPPIGAMEHSEYQVNELTMKKQEALVFITDGLSEMEDANQVMYSTCQLVADLHEVREADAQTVVEHMLTRVFGHAGSTPQFDDVTTLVLRLTHD